jgi:organic hydroperoxide reductase OsmC/OhrA
MSEHSITLEWSRGNGSFERGNFPRNHTLKFEGGQTLTGSASAEFGGDAGAVDPEQLLLSALSSCHMLTFLAVVANRGYVVDSYTDAAVALLNKDADGHMAVVKAILSPKVAFSAARQPSPEEYAKFHERAHAACFIANSVRAQVELRI